MPFKTYWLRPGRLTPGALLIFFMLAGFGLAAGLGSPAWAEEPAAETAAVTTEKDATAAPAEAPPAAEAPAPAEAPPAAEASAPVPAFTFADVEKLAWQQAGKSFKAADSRLIEALRTVTEQQWNAIAFKDEGRLWHEAGLPFEVGFFHPGFIFNQPVTISEVDGGLERPVAFNPGLFDLGDPALAEKMAALNLNFAGFRLYYPINDGDRKNEVTVFLGGTHFRAVARKSGYGLTARGLILNPAMSEGEEFPYFRRFWLVRPEPDAASLTLYALLESPSLTGAYQFVITPGTSTVMEVKARLFKRSGAHWPKKIGLGPVGSMYLFSEKENGSSRDWRPEVHNSDSLLMTTDQGEWFHRPLVNPERLATVSGFELSGLKGFGLMQRDADFDHYQDIDARFEHRPSLWIEPLGDSAKGRLELIEIPSTKDYNDNILAFWLPDRSGPDAASGSQTEPADSGTEMALAYRLYWMAPGATPHQLGRVVSTRRVLDPQAETATFVLDFESEDLNAIPADTGLASQIETGEAYPVLEKSLRKNPVTGGWRLKFKVRLPQEKSMVQSLISAGEERVSSRFSARLIKGENLPEPLTETWVCDQPPQRNGD